MRVIKDLDEPFLSRMIPGFHGPNVLVPGDVFYATLDNHRSLKNDRGEPALVKNSWYVVLSSRPMNKGQRLTVRHVGDDRYVAFTTSGRIAAFDVRATLQSTKGDPEAWLALQHAREVQRDKRPAGERLVEDMVAQEVREKTRAFMRGDIVVTLTDRKGKWKAGQQARVVTVSHLGLAGVTTIYVDAEWITTPHMGRDYSAVTFHENDKIALLSRPTVDAFTGVKDL